MSEPERARGTRPGTGLGARFVAPVLPVLLAVAVIGFGGTFVYYATARLVALGLAAVVLGAYWLAALRYPSWRPQSHLLPALAVCAGAFGVAAVTSRSMRISSEYLAYAILLGSLYLVLRQLLTSAAFRRRLEFGVMVCAFVIPVAYIGIVVRDWIEWWGLVGAIVTPPLRPAIEGLTYANPSGAMAASVLATTSAIAIVDWKTPTRRAILVVLIAITLATALLSGSRTGYLALAIAVGALLVLSVARGTWRRRISPRRLGATLTVAVITGAVMILALGPAVATRLFSGGQELRAGIYLISVRMIEAAPLTGVGPGMWQVERARYVEHPETNIPIPHGHDVYLQTAAETGLLGVAAGAVLAVFIARLFRRGLRDPDPQTERWVWAAVFGTVYLAGHQLLDFWMNSPGLLLLWAFPVALLDARLPERPGRPVPTWAWLSAVIVLALALAWPISRDVVALDFEAGVRAADAGDWQTAGERFATAASADPDLPPNAFARGIALARDGDLAGAHVWLARVARADDDPLAWLALAAVEAQMGGTDSEGPLVRALRLGRQQTVVTVPAAQLAEEPADVLAIAIESDPSLAGDPWVQATLGTRIDDVLRALPPAPRWEAALYAGRNDEARELALEAGAGSAAQTYIDAWAGVNDAREELERLALADPYNIFVLGWAARAAAHAGDDVDANRYRRWAELVSTRASIRGYVTVVRADAPSRDALAGFTTLFHGPYAYRRTLPWDQVMPWLDVPVRE